MGPRYEFSRVIDLNSALVGRWLICPGAGTALPDMPSDSVGIEFETTRVNSEWSLEGNLYYLVASASGPVRGGPNHQFAYLVYRVDNDASITLHIDLGYPFYAIPPLRYSPCPKLFEIIGQQSDGAPGDHALLTPL
jgi:hypothetical protein